MTAGTKLNLLILLYGGRKRQGSTTPASFCRFKKIIQEAEG
jgi:hypothetical protein